MEYKDYYKVLGVARTANADEIKRAYRKLARRYHPDVSKEAQAEEKFKEVQEAYEVLRDTEKRAAYDQLGAQWKAGEQFRPPPTGGRDLNTPSVAAVAAVAKMRRGSVTSFANLFGSRSPFGPSGGSSFRRRGGDRHARIEIDLADAYQGAERMIRLQNPEVTPEGRVTLREKEVRVTIPAGVTEGQQIRLRGQGEAAPRRGQRGRPVPGDQHPAPCAVSTRGPRHHRDSARCPLGGRIGRQRGGTHPGRPGGNEDSRWRACWSAAQAQGAWPAW